MTAQISSFRFVTGLLVLAAGAAQAQSPNGDSLRVVNCDPVSNTCGESDNDSLETFSLPVLGAADKATALTPDRRTTKVELGSTEYRVLIPGCDPVQPGVFVCNSVHEYQHCRTLMFSSMVHSCRIDAGDEVGIAAIREAPADEIGIEIESNAKVRVERGMRGFGQTRGEADVEIALAVPAGFGNASCLQRDRYLFAATGPDAGYAEIDDTADCDEPLEFSFKPHEDDVVRAYDICETFVAWGDEIEDSIEILAAGLFHLSSDDPAFEAEYPGGMAIIASQVTVQAPLTIDCRD